MAEREVSQLSAERSKLMNELDTSEPEETMDPAADEDLDAGFSPDTSYAAAAPRAPDQCSNPVNAINNPQCVRTAGVIDAVEFFGGGVEIVVWGVRWLFLLTFFTQLCVGRRAGEGLDEMGRHG